MAEHIEQAQAYLARFGAKLRRLRLELGLTQDQLAKRAGLHRTFIGQLELGRRGVNLAALPRLAQALRLDDHHHQPPAAPDRMGRRTVTARRRLAGRLRVLQSPWYHGGTVGSWR